MSYRGRTLVINNLVATFLWHRLACLDPPVHLLWKITIDVVTLLLGKIALNSTKCPLFIRRRGRTRANSSAKQNRKPFAWLSFKSSWLTKSVGNLWPVWFWELWEEWVWTNPYFWWIPRHWTPLSCQFFIKIFSRYGTYLLCRNATKQLLWTGF